LRGLIGYSAFSFDDAQRLLRAIKNTFEDRAIIRLDRIEVLFGTGETVFGNGIARSICDFVASLRSSVISSA
jgi:hypothetical protein